MAALTSIDTHLRKTTTLSYILEGQNRVNEESTITYSKKIGADYVQISAVEWNVIKAAHTDQVCRIIRVASTDDIAVTPLKNSLHQRVTITSHRETILRRFVKYLTPVFTTAPSTI